MIKSDGTILPVLSKSYNPYSDIAHLTVESNQFKPLQVSQYVGLGEDIFIIGNPNGFQNTVTKGIVSYKSRYNKYIQFDGYANEGSSGGVILNKKCYAIGMFRLYTTEAFGQINFAIPIQEVLK